MVLNCAPFAVTLSATDEIRGNDATGAFCHEPMALPIQSRPSASYARIVGTIAGNDTGEIAI